MVTEIDGVGLSLDSVRKRLTQGGIEVTLD